MSAALGERDAVPGLVVCVQTFGSVAHFHPHLHVLTSDGAFRRDGTFVPLPEPDAAMLEELWRRMVLAEFVRRGWLDEDAWPTLRARRRRWAELLRLVFRVEVEVCPRCGGEARIVAFITEPAVVRRILGHLERRGVEVRAGPWAGAAAAPG